MPARYRDRAEGGRRLADRLADRSLHQPVVLALPRGGVPVGFEIATRLGAPLDVFVARKVGAPGQPELGIGAIAEGGNPVLGSTATGARAVSREQFDLLAERERRELDRRVAQYRAGRSLPALTGRDVIVVDDGLATGVTAEAALGALRSHSPRRLILAVPVGAPETIIRLRDAADEIVCTLIPVGFGAVGAWYDVFDQTSDEEVLDLLSRASSQHCLT